MASSRTRRSWWSAARRMSASADRSPTRWSSTIMLRTTYHRSSARRSRAGGAITGPRETRRSRMRRRRDLSFSSARASRNPRAARLAERVQEAARHRRGSGSPARERIQHRRHRFRSGHASQRLVHLGTYGRPAVARIGDPPQVFGERRGQLQAARGQHASKQAVDPREQGVGAVPAREADEKLHRRLRQPLRQRVVGHRLQPVAQLRDLLGGDEHRHLDGGGLQQRLVLLRVVAVDVVVAEEHGELGQEGGIRRLHLAQAGGGRGRGERVHEAQGMARERDFVLDPLQGLQDGVGRETAGQGGQGLRRRLVAGQDLDRGRDEHVAQVGRQGAHQLRDLIGGEDALGGRSLQGAGGGLGHAGAQARPRGGPGWAVAGPSDATAGPSTSPSTAAIPRAFAASPASTSRRPSAERTCPARMVRRRSSHSERGAGSSFVSSVSRTCEKSTDSTRTWVTPPAVSSSARGRASPRALTALIPRSRVSSSAGWRPGSRRRSATSRR